jgi:hypothetical protein
MDKKGFYFTTIAISLSIVIILSYNIYSGPRLKDSMEATEIRISTMNDFIKDLENDVDNAISIAGFRSLLSLEDYMMENNNPVDLPKFFGTDPEDLGIGFDTAFDEVFRLGTINGEKMLLMVNNTFGNWTLRMIDQANKTGIKLEINIDSVTISQSDPWLVDIEVQLDIDADDNKGTASWDIDDKEYTGQINISSELAGNHKFVDPLYLAGTDGVVNNTFRETTYSDWPSDLNAHLSNAYYREHNDAPSYLQRFEFDRASPQTSAHGIESMVVDLLQSEGVAITIKSAIDHIYFSSLNPGKCPVVDVGDPEFRLDDPTHTGFYSTSCVV